MLFRIFESFVVAIAVIFVFAGLIAVFAVLCFVLGPWAAIILSLFLFVWLFVFIGT